MAQITFNSEAGAFVRGRLKRVLRQYAWDRGYEISIQEDKGLFDSLLRVKLTLPDEDYDYVMRSLKHFFNQFD